MLCPKKDSYKELDNENSSPTHNFSNGPSLSKKNKSRNLLLLRELCHEIQKIQTVKTATNANLVIHEINCSKHKRR